MRGAFIKNVYRYAIPVVVLCLLVLCAVPCPARALTKEEAQALSNELTAKFESYGSFKAQYLIKSEGKELTVLLARNDDKKYFLFKTLKTNADAYPTVVMEYGGGAFLLKVLPSGGDKISVTDVNKELNDFKNEHIFLYISVLVKMGLLDEGAADFADSLDDLRLSPRINLSVDQKDAKVDLLLHRSESPSIGWLDPGLFASEGSVDQSDGRVVVWHSGGNKTTIDRTNGLLLEDVWTIPDETAGSSVRLLGVKKLDGAATYMDLAPELANTDYEQIKSSTVFRYLMTELGGKINAIFERPGLRAALEEKKEDFEQLLADAISAFFEEGMTDEFLQAFMIAAYQEYKTSGGEAPIAYEDFIRDKGKEMMLKYLQSIDLERRRRLDDALSGSNDTARKTALLVFDLGAEGYRRGVEKAAGNMIPPFVKKEQARVAQCVKGAQGGTRTADVDLDGLAGEVREAFKRLGSFEARWLIGSADEDVSVLLIHDQKEQYLFMVIERRDNNMRQSSTISGLMVYGEKKRILALLLPGHEDIGEGFYLDMIELWKHIPDYAPFQGYMEVLSHMGVLKGKSFTGKIGTSSILPIVNLFLDDEGAFNASLGFSDKELSLNWFDPETVKTSERIEEKDGKIIIHYPQGHRVVIDAGTGLLLEESQEDSCIFPDQGMKLVDLKKTKGGVPYREKIPWLQSEIDKVRSNQHEGQALKKNMSWLFALFADNLFGVLKYASIDASQVESRQDEFIGQVKDQVQDYWGSRLSESRIEELLEGAYRGYQFAHKGEAPSFEEFLSAEYETRILSGIPSALFKTLPFYMEPDNIDAIFASFMDKVKEETISRVNQLGNEAYMEALKQLFKERLNGYLETHHSTVFARLKTKG